VAQITPKDIISLRKVADVQLAADGATIAYTVTTPAPVTSPKNTHIWITPTSGPGLAHILTLSDATESSPRFSPDGKTLAFLSDRADPITLDATSPFPFHLAKVESRPEIVEVLQGKPSDKPSAGHDKPTSQIWMMALSGGEATPLTGMPGGIKAFSWSPDGKTIAFIRKDERTKAQREKIEHKDDSYPVDRDYLFDRIYLYDLAEHTARLLTTGDRNIDDMDWSPDGSRIVVRVSPTPRINDYWRVSKIQILSAATGEVEKTLCEHASSAALHWSRDGDHLTYSRETEKGITGVPVLYTLSTGKELVVGRNLPATWNTLSWSGDGSRLVLTGLERTIGVVADVDLGTGDATLRTEKSFAQRNFVLSRDGSIAATVAETTSHPGEVATLKGSQWTTLTETNPQVNAWHLGEVREVSWKSKRDGKTIYGVLLLPSDYHPGQRYKTLVQLHGGPEGSWDIGWLGSWHDWARMLTTHGYAVFLPNPRGSDGQGTAFTEANYQDWGGGDFQDVMDGTDAMIAQGVVDPEKMVVGGWSYGGFMTSWSVTHTDRFKAAVMGAGVTDLFSMATTSDIVPDFLGGYFGPFDKDPAIYDAHSPMRYINRCHTPTLVIHGEADERVPTFQGQEFYNALRFMGRETQMVRYPREPHVFAEMDHQIDLLSRVLAWYDSHLQ
jgi:dipeptidyl aminopeptidase/acylaminoacyl peptidase